MNMKLWELAITSPTPDAEQCSIFCPIFDDLRYFLLNLVSEGMIGYNNSHILDETQTLAAKQPSTNYQLIVNGLEEWILKPDKSPIKQQHKQLPSIETL